MFSGANNHVNNLDLHFSDVFIVCFCFMMYVSGLNIVLLNFDYRARISDLFAVNFVCFEPWQVTNFAHFGTELIQRFINDDFV